MKARELRLQLFKPVTTSEFQGRTVKTLLSKTEPDRSITTVQTVIGDVEEIAIQVRDRTTERVGRGRIVVGNHVEQLIAPTIRIETLKRPNHHATENLLRQSISSQTKVVGKGTDDAHERDTKTRSLVETEDVFDRLHPRSLVLHKRMDRAKRHAAVERNGNLAAISRRSRDVPPTILSIDVEVPM